MNSSDLLRFVKGVFETEIDLYVQKETLYNMQNTYNNLATGLKVYAPSKKAK